MNNHPKGQNQKKGNVDTKELEKIALRLTKEKDPKIYDDYCDKIRAYVESQGKFSPTQVRNIFNRVRRVESVIEIKKLRPIFAYIGARNKINKFTDLLDNIVKSITDEESLKSFKEFLKIIVAYKKALER